ncbi:MAG: asparagine--tRNA ligase [Nitrospirae bacterium]|nr:asparagine--tRNA ligase [Nitrospirota bacterium]
MKRNRIRDILSQTQAGGIVTVAGWARTVRSGKGVTFIEINDGSCLANIQAVAETAAHDASLGKISTGASLRVSGRLVDSPGAGQRFEIAADEIALIGAAPPDYPLQKKRHSFEFLREIAHLRPRTNTFGAVLRVRSAMAQAVHEFFRNHGFLYIHTPIITTSDCEGAGEMFSVSASGGEAAGTAHFFGKPAGLTVSGQLEAELVCMALGDVYTFGPTFRAENSNTSRHLSEFWMVEPEMAFAGLDEDARLAEDFLKHLFRAVLAECPEDMAFFDKWVFNGAIERLEKIASSGFSRVTYTEAVGLLEKSGEKFEFAPAWGADLQSEHERYLAERVFGGPVIVTDYPKDIKAFYMKLNDDGRTVRAMDVLVPGVGEIIGGSQREDDLEKLEGRLRSIGLDTAPYWWYLDTRRYGSAPHAGFGLGFERAVQFVTGMQNIRDTIPFPRVPRHADF